MNKREFTYFGHPDYMTQLEARNYLGMQHMTFLRHTSLLGIYGIRESKYTMYRRADIERLKNLRTHAYSRALQFIEKQVGKPIKQIVFEED